METTTNPMHLISEPEQTWADFERNIELVRRTPASDPQHEAHELWKQILQTVEGRAARMQQLAARFGIEQTPPDWLNQFDDRERAYFDWLRSMI